MLWHVAHIKAKRVHAYPLLGDEIIGWAVCFGCMGIFVTWSNPGLL